MFFFDKTNKINKDIVLINSNYQTLIYDDEPILYL